MSGIARLKNRINDSLGLNEWGNRDVIPNDFNTEIIETNQEFQNATIDSSKIKNLNVDTITVSSTGYIKSGKTSFADSTNAGYYFSADGIYVGAASDATYLKYNISTGAFEVKAAITTTAGSSLGTSYLSGLVGLANTNISAQGWTNTCVFSATDYRVVAWAGGTITTAAGTAYTITGSNTGNMATTTYIYLDIAVSTTALQITTTAATAIGSGKILIATASPNTDTTSKAQYQVFGGIGGVRLFVDNISANSASTNEFVSNTAQIANLVVTDAKIATLAVSKLTAGTITSKTITLAVSDGSGDTYIAAGKTDFTNTDSGFILGVDDSDSNKAKFYIGDVDKYLNWDGSSLIVRGESVFSEFNGSSVDGLTETTANATIARKPINTYIFNSTAGNWDLNTVMIGYKDFAGNELDWDVSYDFYCRLACDTGIADSGGSAGAAMAWGLENNTLKMTSATLPLGTTTAITTRHILFINDKDGKLYASCANGTTQTTSEITGITVGSENNYRIRFTTGTSAKFYVNDVLKATLTTNLPTGTTDKPDIMFWGAVGRNVANAIDTLLYNNYKLIIN